MAYTTFEMLEFAIWILVIVAGLLAFLYPFLEKRREQPDKESS